MYRIDIKIMKKILLFIVFIFIANASAQNYGDAYHAADQASIQRAANERANATNDEHYRNINSNSNNASSSIKYDQSATNLEIFNKGYYDKVYKDQIQRRIDEAKANAVQQAAHDEYDRLRYVEQQKYINNKNLWIQSQTSFYTSRGLTVNEAVEALEIQNFLAGSERVFPQQEYNEAAESLSKFNKNISKETFDNLLNMVWQGRRFPESANVCLDLLKKKFPEKIDYLEEIEFKIMSNYFGGQQPFAVDYGTEKYPKAIIEVFTVEKVQKIYARFDYLANKYPTIALKMAGSCREQLNPFDIERWSKYDFMSKDKNLRFNAAKNVLFSEHPKMRINSIDYQKWIKFYEKRLRNTIDWLNNDYPDYIKNLTPTDWARIQKAQNTDYYYIWLAFRKDFNKYENKYSALKKAMNGEGFDEGPQSGKGSVFIGVGDFYEGNFENGKPNGKGKYTYNDGSNYEGNFKDGKFDGNGTINWANNTGYIGNFSNNKMNGLGKYFYSNGQIYEGNFKNDAFFGEGIMNFNDGGIYKGNFVDNKRTGKGTVKFKNGTSYEGDWKDDAYDGQGIFKLLNGFYKKGTYKKGAENDIKYYNNQDIEISLAEFNGMVKKGL